MNLNSHRSKNTTDANNNRTNVATVESPNWTTTKIWQNINFYCFFLLLLRAITFRSIFFNLIFCSFIWFLVVRSSKLNTAVLVNHCKMNIEPSLGAITRRGIRLATIRFTAFLSLNICISNFHILVVKCCNYFFKNK